MSHPNRETEAELLTEISKLLGSPEIILIRKWIETLYEEAKDNLVNCDHDALSRIQAEAQAYKNILRKLQRAAHKREQQLKDYR